MKHIHNVPDHLQSSFIGLEHAVEGEEELLSEVFPRSRDEVIVGSCDDLIRLQIVFNFRWPCPLLTWSLDFVPEMLPGNVLACFGGLTGQLSPLKSHDSLVYIVIVVKMVTVLGERLRCSAGGIPYRYNASARLVLVKSLFGSGQINFP